MPEAQLFERERESATEPRWGAGGGAPLRQRVRRHFLWNLI